ncbi:hypothetical protein LWI29_033700 [Acer saccharum]|uniref:Peptidase S9A N-terminal domain-containing protein n=1 Tax=Acer saccharum TaxID=4024 RepID=A0AA39RIU5_ACESA|nr:hypothetical protein LWI29_033700 [Acer saccharum]
MALLPSLFKSNLALSFKLIPAISSSLCRLHTTFTSPQQPPPVPKKLPFTVSANGFSWQDPYHWMKHTDDPDFIKHLHRENSYAHGFMADTHNLQRTLFSEMKNRMPTNISTPPERWGPWLYYQYIPEGKEYPLLCRRLETILLNSKGGFPKEQILLDWNEVAEKHGYVHVGTCRVSPDHNVLAYTLDTTGSERFILQIKDLRNGYMVPRLPVDGVVSLAWAQDSKTLFYTISDENQRPCRVLCTKLGSDNTDDVPVFTEGLCDRCSQPISWLAKNTKACFWSTIFFGTSLRFILYSHKCSFK